MQRGGRAESMMRRIVLGSAVSILATSAWAGEFFEKDGVALRGHDPIGYFVDKRPVKGSAEHTAQYKGSTFQFASKANRDIFVADPARYAPQYGGFCAYGAAGGYKATSDPTAFSIVDGKLYLNYDRNVQKKWSADAAGYIVKADEKWPAVSQQTKVIE